MTAVRYGMSPDGIQFQDDALFKPLQAADIFAWQVQNHMRRSVMVGIPSSARKAHPNVRMTLENKLVSIAYFGTEQLEDVFSKAKLYKQNHGKWPWEDIPFRNRAKLGKAGRVY